MPSRQAVAKELGVLFKTISHPDRIGIIECLRDEGLNVGELARRLELPNSRVSQHLSALRTLGLVDAESRGREQFYQLRDPKLALWVVEGIDFVANRVGGVDTDDIVRARELWGLSTATSQ